MKEDWIGLQCIAVHTARHIIFENWSNILVETFYPPPPPPLSEMVKNDMKESLKIIVYKRILLHFLHVCLLHTCMKMLEVFIFYLYFLLKGKFL
jgi:hypothetical protein